LWEKQPKVRLVVVAKGDPQADMAVEKTIDRDDEAVTYHERLGELLPSDKWVESGLLGRPALYRVQIQQTLAKVDKRSAVVQF
jgi:hypothetical protein